MAQDLTEISKGVTHLPLSVANIYFVGQYGRPWVLVDTGLPGKARLIREAAERLFGPGAKPQAIVLTHGHLDHSGSALDLAAAWGVPILAHRLEMPYLTGRSFYPPGDPTAPGLLALLTRFTGPQKFDFGERVRTLESQVPGMEGWEWHHTPGHAPGHVCFFRREDATLLAGDALTTMDLDSFFAVAAKKQQVCRPPTPLTYDWGAAANSVRALDALNPLTLACGHGVPMSGADAADQLARLAYRFPIPSHGRYAMEPAETDENGVTYLPPAPPDRAPAIAGTLAISALMGAMFARAVQKRRGQVSDSVQTT